jgi:hypothetical protein
MIDAKFWSKYASRDLSNVGTFDPIDAEKLETFSQ